MIWRGSHFAQRHEVEWRHFCEGVAQLPGGKAGDKIIFHAISVWAPIDIGKENLAITSPDSQAKASKPGAVLNSVRR